MPIRSNLSLLAAAALVSAPALAQTAPQTAPPPGPAATATAPAPAATAAATASAAVTDEEVTKFTTAAIAVEKVSNDTTVTDADKQTKMAAAVTGAGLDPARFNAIAAAVKSDPAVKARVQAEYAKQNPAPAK
jgi:hypothetical protein